VLGVDPEKKRISLGMKQISPNPWDVVAEKYPEGTVLEGAIKNITEFGVFIGIEEGIDGLIHVSDISWTKKIRHPSEVYKVGDSVQAKVLTVDKENEKFTLGVKQLTEDPWTQVPAKYPVGQKVTGTVTNITDFGLFVEVEEGIEGLVHVSEISRKKIKSPSEMFKEGDSIEAKVIHVSADERRLGLSIKQTKEEPARSGGGKSKSFGGDSVSAGSTLGDLLREKLEEAAGDALAAAEEEEAAEAPVEETVVEAAPAEAAPAEETAESEAPAEEAAAEEEESK
jgi:small subunit ribosomal protein S1